jgi:carbon monoxide dehydrogenase subunit G
MDLKMILALAGAATILSGCSGLHGVFNQGPQVTGSGKLKSETRKIGNFSKIESRGSADCKVTVGKAVGLTIQADDNILPLVETTIEKDTLIINCKGSFSTHNGIVVTISVPNLESFYVKGSGDSSIQGVRGKSFSVEIAGSGDINAAGQVDKSSASIRGSGDIDFSNLRAREAVASISGSGDIAIFASHALDASIRGSGDISYLGNPSDVGKSVSGSGEINPK